MYHPFSVTETISIAWHILKKNFATIAVYGLVAFVIFVVIGFVVRFILVDEDIILQGVAVVIFLFMLSFIYLSFIKLIFLFIDKEYYEFEFKDIIPRISTLLSYIILLVIVSSISVFSGAPIKNMDDGLIKSVLEILSVIFIEAFFLFYFPVCACFIVDDQSGPFESVMQSFKLIKGNFLKYFILFLIIETMVFLGTMTLIGMAFVIPFVNIILAVAYRKLVYSHIDADDEIAETL